MSCHSPSLAASVSTSSKRIALVGNPNTGKSLIFNRLTRGDVDVSNFPGTTVDIHIGAVGEYTVIDTPGVYGIGSFSEDERVTRDMLREVDAVVNVVDAQTLERDLFLTIQVLETGLPAVVVLNMMDEVERAGMTIDLAELERLLGVPVIPTVAPTGQGLPELTQSLGGLTRTSNSSLFDVERMIKLSEGSDGESDKAYAEWRRRASDIARSVTSANADATPLRARLGRWLLRPWPGFLVLLAVLGALYYLMGVFVAQTLVGFLEETIMQGVYVPFIENVTAQIVPTGSILWQFLVGEFGVLTMPLTYLVGLLLPLVATFYLCLSLLEDAGYLPRVAVLLDRFMTKLGLNGRAVIPMILGFGCVTMATMTTRILQSKRERTIATVLLAMAVPCSAQLGVIAILLAPLGPTYTSAYLGIVFLVYGLVGRGLHAILPGDSSYLFLEIPSLRMPSPANVITKTWRKSKAFLAEAVPLFVYTSLIITTMQASGLLQFLEKAIAPITTEWLRLPPATATAFIMGLIRRDFGAAGLYNLNLSPESILVASVTITLFVPCIASMMVIVKEQGWLKGTVIFTGTFSGAFLIGGLVTRLLAAVV